jgi:predicted kinase
LWADHIRRELFNDPTYSHTENIKLYDHLNKLTAELLAAENSVVFDTNFNFYKDRRRLREIASEHDAEVEVIWVTTPKDIARNRATKDAHKQDNRVLGDIPVDDFERMSNNLEPPHGDEQVIEIEGIGVTSEVIKEKLGLEHAQAD